MKHLKSLVISSVLVSQIIGANVAPSQNPPGKLDVSNVPQFLVIGFDDNLEAEGLEWILDYTDKLVNNGDDDESETYDKTPVRFSYYNNTKNGFSSLPDDLIEQEIRAYEMGNEIGNHTAHHWHTATKDADGLVIDVSAENWEEEISLAKSDLLDAGISKSEDMVGFRAPFLEYSNSLFETLKDGGFVYDCSIEEGGQYMSASQDGTDYFWPYTLDGGSPGHNEGWNNDSGNENQFEVTSVPGLWELPNHLLVVPADDDCSDYDVDEGLRAKVAGNIAGETTGDYYSELKSTGMITGFDYNLWTSSSDNGASLDSAEVLAILKYTLDLRLEGNRAPFMFGAHTQFYTANADKVENFSNSTFMERRWAIEQFIEYAQTKDDVRMVPGIKIIEWCENPVGLDGEAGTTAIKLGVQKKLVNNNVILSSNKLSITTNASALYNISIVGMNGKVIWSAKSINLSANSANFVNVDLPKSNNFYIVKLSSNGNTNSFKVVNQ